MTLRRRGALIVLTTVTLGIVGVGALAWTLVGGSLRHLATLHAEQDVYDVIGAITADAGRRSTTATVAVTHEPLAAALAAGLPLTEGLQQHLLDITQSDAAVWRPEGGAPEVVAGTAAVLDTIAVSTARPYWLAGDGDGLWVATEVAAGVAVEPGHLILLRALDRDYQDYLATVTGSPIEVVPVAAGMIDLTELSPTTVREALVVDGSHVDAALRSPEGTVARLIAPVNAEVDATTRELAVLAGAVLVVGGIAAGGLTLRLFDRRILSRIGRLTRLVASTDRPDRPAVALDGSDELSQLAARIEAAFQRLEQAQEELARQGRELAAANAAKDRFLSFLSHEFRTPLTALAGWAETLEVHGERMDADRRRDVVTRMGRQVGVLDDMVDDVLLLTRASAGDGLMAQPEDVEVAPLLADVATDLAPRVPAEVTVDVRDGPGRLRVRADRSHLYRIVANYLINAAKYGAPPFELLATRVEDAPMVRITIVDHGPGVPPEFRDALFAEFSQADPRVRTHAGVGLGLAIVAHLAAANGGTVGYAPNEPTGSRFWVNLPGV